MLYFNTNVGATLVGKKSPFPLASHDSRSVLAVKGSLRRFAPWTAAGRSGETRCSRGKRGGGRAEREPFGHTSYLSRSRGALSPVGP